MWWYHQHLLRLILLLFGVIITVLSYRDAPEATGEEPEDTDFDMPKIYEPVSIHKFRSLATD